MYTISQYVVYHKQLCHNIQCLRPEWGLSNGGGENRRIGLGENLSRELYALKNHSTTRARRRAGTSNSGG